MTDLNGNGYRFLRPAIDSLTDRECDVLRRISQGFSDQEIARDLFLSINTVKWHNRNIYAKLGVKCRTQAAVYVSVLGLMEEKPPDKKPSNLIKKHNLPAQISSFIGREDHIQKIKTLLGENRLVTLTGPGGVGKTRLALQVADELVGAEGYQDGAFFVELAAISSPDRIGNTILDVLGIQTVPDQPTVQPLNDYLEARELLLVLDNFEHLLDGAGIVRELLESAPNLVVLCTSREALKLSGEQVFPVTPLEIQSSQELFIQRAREIQPDCNFTDKDLPRIDQICARLDRLPLAIELAAARMNLFSLKTLLERLEDRFEILTDARRDVPARHQNLQKTIDWSFDLLGEEEQILFQRLAVFQGTRSIDAVEEVCCFDLQLDVLDGLTSLLSKNLIRQEEGLDGQPRFYLLETVHEFCRAKLAERGEQDAIQKRHAGFFTALAEEAKYPTRGGANQIRWLKRIKMDYRNLVSMFDWSMSEGESLFGLRMLGALGHIWGLTGYGNERPQLVSQALDKIHDAPEEIKAGIWSVAGKTNYFSGDIQSSNLMYTQALEVYRELDNIRDTAWTIVFLIQPLIANSADSSDVLKIINEAIELFGNIPDKVGLVEAYSTLGNYEQKLGNYKKARIALEKSLVIARETDDEFTESIVLMELGFLELDKGNPERAQSLFVESLNLELSADFSLSFAIGTFIALSGCAISLRNPQRAAVLLGAVKAHYLDKGYIFHPVSAQQYSDYRDAARSQLDEGIYQQAWEEGQVMSPEEAIAFALEEDIPD